MRGVQTILGLCAAASLLYATSSAHAQAILTLEAALEHARAHAPELSLAQTSIAAARARIDVARAPRLPQVTGSVTVQRSTYNGGSLGSSSAAGAMTDTAAGSAGLTAAHSRFDMRNQFNASIRATQLLYDFGQSSDTLRATEASAQAQEQSARATTLDVDHAVRSAFLDAAAARALVQVADEALANQTRHLAQIQGFVQVGTRPAIDLAQSRTEVASAKLSLLRSQTSYAVAKTQLERAMGYAPAGDYDVSSQVPDPEPEEGAALDRLIDQAERTRPEFAALQYQLRAQELTLSANETGYAPSLLLQANASEAGSELDSLAWNLGAGVSLSWPIFQGGIVDARVREARATLAGFRIQRELLHKDTRRELEQALLSLKAAQDALEIAGEIVTNAKERLRLAEGRYAAGVGNVIELGDAQLVLSNAQSQRVSATYELGQARLQLRVGLGR